MVVSDVKEADFSSIPCHSSWVLELAVPVSFFLTPSPPKVWHSDEYRMPHMGSDSLHMVRVLNWETLCHAAYR
jgi:hypothetical protein